MTDVVAPVRLPIDMGNDFDEFDKSIVAEILSRSIIKESMASRSSALPPTSPRAVHVFHSHFLLSPLECKTIFRWFHDKRLQCDEIMESFFDTRDGVFWKSGSKWLKLERVFSSSEGQPSPAKRAGFWTLKWEAEREADVEYQEISYRTHPEQSKAAKRIVNKLKEEFNLQPDAKCAIESPLAYLPVNICSYFCCRYTPKKRSGLRWWVDCAQLTNPRLPGQSYYYTVLTVDIRYGGENAGASNDLDSMDSDPIEDEEVVRMKVKAPSALSKVIVALALRDKKVPVSLPAGSLSYDAALKLCESECVLMQDFAADEISTK